MRRTVADALADGCGLCSCVLEPETAVVGVAKIALEGGHPLKWSPGHVVFLCEVHGDLMGDVTPEPDEMLAGSFDVMD